MSSKLAVHLHLYYFWMWDSIKEYLSNIDGEYLLYVTMTKENQEIAAKIKAFHPNSKIVILDNRGHDVGPFIYFLKDINLDDYDFIMKLHTKRDDKPNFTYFKDSYVIRNNRWFNLLMNALLESKDVYKANLNKFSKDPTLGMIGSKYLNFKGKDTLMQNTSMIDKYLAKMNFSYNENMSFIGGTMFIVRAPLLKVVRDCVDFSNFDHSKQSSDDGTLAHAFERILGFVIGAQGYQIKGFDKNSEVIKDSIYLFYVKHPILKKIISFFYVNNITQSNYHIIRILMIPVLHKKVKTNLNQKDDR